MTIITILLVIALVCAVLALIGVPSRVDLTALGVVALSIAGLIAVG